MTKENRVKNQENQNWKAWMPAEDIKVYNEIIPLTKEKAKVAS